MRLVFYGSRPFDREFFEAANVHAGHELVFLEAHLDARTARLAECAPAVCAFVNDRVDRDVLQTLQAVGVRFLLLRSAGYTTSTWTPPANSASRWRGCRRTRRMPWPSTRSA